MRAPSSCIRRGVASAAFFLLVSTGLAHAHGSRLPFAEWGGFAPEAARCQRVIARAGAQCASQAWALRRACRAAVLAGQPCDEAATTDAIAAVRNRALDVINGYCTDLQARALQYLSLSFDLQNDVVDFCRDSVSAADSGVFRPALDGGTLSAVERRCIAATADAATDAMGFAFRNRRRCMDHLAVIDRGTPERAAEIAQADARLSRTATALAGQLAARCGAGVFDQLYGRSPAQLLGLLGQRADCIGGRFYIQDAVLCPASVCGNGVVEPGEDCDDGNTASGDGCAADCVQ